MKPLPRISSLFITLVNLSKAPLGFYTAALPIELSSQTMTGGKSCPIYVYEIFSQRLIACRGGHEGFQFYFKTIL